MMSSLLFYISGHGFGHARRMTQVIRELLNLFPDTKIRVRSAAPVRVLQPAPAEWIEPCDIDAGLVEHDPLAIDRAASLNRLMAFMSRRGAIMAEELAAVRRLKPSLIVSDIPFLAGDVAAEAGVPCVGISNFTWDWIYENLFATDPRYQEMSGAIAGGYAKMSALLELPFGHACEAIKRKIPTPLIAMRSNREPGEILRQIGVSARDPRPRVLFGTRGTLAPGILNRAATGAAEFLFLCPHVSNEALPLNVMGVSLTRDLDFSDLLRISDVAVSKLGYGIISECIATQTRLVWPPRDGFAEDAVVAADAPKFVPMLQMPAEAYRSGEWGNSLRAALRLPAATTPAALDGARACATFLHNFPG